MTGRSDGDRAWSSLWIYRDTHLILLLLNCEGPPWQWVWESWLRLLTSQSLFSIGNMNDSEWKQHLFHHAYRVSELKFINVFNSYNNPLSSYCYLHFPDEETEAQEVIWQKSAQVYRKDTVTNHQENANHNQDKRLPHTCQNGYHHKDKR